MKKIFFLLCTLVLLIFITDLRSAEKPKSQTHLFILSGQSNMASLDPKPSFIPAVEKEYGKDNTIVVKFAKGGQPIRRWYKDFKYPDNREIKNKKQIGDLYDVLMKKIKAAIKGKKYDTATFVWMQGERDAKEELADVYADSFKGILKQLKEDLKKESIYFVIGRLSDFDMQNKKYKHWTRIRDIQVKLAEEDKNGQWVNCDDLNDGKNKKGKDIKNDLHMSVEGYKIMGDRFAKKAISLIKGTVKGEK